MVSKSLALVTLVLSNVIANPLPPNKKKFAGNNIWTDYESEFYAEATGDDFKWTPDSKGWDGLSGFEYANDQDFPSLILAEASFAVTYLEPCTIDMPHLHPQAAELMYVTKGKIKAGLVDPTQFRSISYDVTVGDFFWAPKDVFQYQSNPYCERAEFISIFNEARIGRIDVADIAKSGVEEFITQDGLCLSQSTYDLISPLDDLSKVDSLGSTRRQACLRKCGLPQD